MKTKLLWVILFFTPALVFGVDAKVNWKLEKSEITYTVTHPLHIVRGKSLSARGEGLRGTDGVWKFLVAVPVKTFDSGDNNRDLHMQEVTRAGLFPLITVRAQASRIIDSQAPQPIVADVDIEFAGQKAEYPQIPLQVLDWKDGRVHMMGTLPLTLKDFKIIPPSLLTLPVQNEVPVKLDMWWSRSKNDVTH
jgi:hypothetical protein